MDFLDRFSVFDIFCFVSFVIEHENSISRFSKLCLFDKFDWEFLLL